MRLRRKDGKRRQQEEETNLAHKESTLNRIAAGAFEIALRRTIERENIQKQHGPVKVIVKNGVPQ